MNNTQNKTRDDVLFVCALLAVAGLFATPVSREWIMEMSRAHSIIASFVKFAILAPLGEMAAARISQGDYLPQRFGLVPKAILWGMFGVLIKLMFMIFATGVPFTLSALGFQWAAEGLKQDLGVTKFVTAFSVSLGMNVIFSPYLMILHKLTDIHVNRQGGSVFALWTRVDWAGNLKRVDWNIMWGFVFMKTIPFFWIPAHTVTFLLPAELQILFAAGLSMALGLILAIAGAKITNPSQKAAAAS